ncbi:MAG: DNA repair protein RecO [Gammaproteobacteria bacterium]
MSDLQRATLEPAFILHTRAYRESSRIIDAFSRRHGRIAAVARGIRRPRARLRAAIQPFRPLLLSWSGRGSLHTLTGAEGAGPSVPLGGEALMSGWYVNELILRLLERDDPHPSLYARYAQTLAELAAGPPHARSLRRFEKSLLDELGYGLNLERDIVNALPVRPDGRYRFRFEEGPSEADGNGADVYAGASLLALASGELNDEQSLRDARRLLRTTLEHYLGGRPLKTREVLRAMKGRGS